MNSAKDKLGIEFLLCLLLGIFGIHRFYTKRYISAILMLFLTLTKWGLLITIPLVILDLIIIFVYFISSNKNTDEENIDTTSYNLEVQKIKKVDINKFIENEKFFEKTICPYCQKQLPDRKTQAFICPNCKNKIYKRTNFISKKYVYLTEQEKPIFEELRQDYSNYKNYTKLCDTIIQTGLMSVSKSNPQVTITKLHFGKKIYYKNKKYLSDLRMARFYEGEIQKIYGTIEQATNAFMTVLYIDLCGDYNGMYDYDKSEPEWHGGIIAPGIYSRAFREKLSLEKFEKIFKFNAESLANTIQYSLPVSPNEAWQKILEYQNTLAIHIKPDFPCHTIKVWQSV